MKNTKTKNHFAVKFLSVTIVCAFLLASCSSLGGFSRRTAAVLIEKDNRYSGPASMTIDIGGRIANAAGRAWQISRDDTVEAAAVRAKEDFMQRQPQLIAAEQLGYIQLNFEEGELGESQMGMPIELREQKLGTWNFKVNAQITDQGRALWTDLNLPVKEKELPLAVRGAVTITGLKDENQTMKSADFTYRWEANELGKAFDPNSDQFKQLPQNLQEALKKTQYNMFGGGGNNTMNFNSTRGGKAYFQKFDDGWRLGQLYFM